MEPHALGSGQPEQPARELARESANEPARDREPATAREQAPGPADERADAERSLLLAALARVEQGERDALEDLHRAICGLVARLRRDGVPRAQIIDMISSVTSGGTSPEASFMLTTAAREALVQLSLEWCVEEYGATGGPGE